MFVVAGVSGNVGSVVADELVKEARQVKVIVRDAAKGAAWSARGAEVAVGSLDDVAFLRGALEGAAGYFTLIPPTYTAPDFFAYQRRIADANAAAVQASRVPHVVLLSSVGADLPEGTGPIRGLHYAETVLRATDAIVTAIRAGYFQENLASGLGPAQQLGIFPTLMAAPETPFPRVATVDIGKAAAAALVAVPRRSQVVDVHGPACSELEVVDKLGRALGKTLKLVPVAPAGRVEALVQAGLPTDLAERYAEMMAAFDKGIIRPSGDRLVHGTTTIDETIAKLVR
jgi:uncharacterized protein YbjT (DUF2867 family)